MSRYAGDARLDRLLGDPLVLENFPHVISVLDRERRILYLNRTVPGRSPSEFIGTDSAEVLAPEAPGMSSEVTRDFIRAHKVG